VILHIPQILLDAFLAHPYAIIFVALLFAGESVLLPAVYYSVTGVLSPEFVFAAALSATVISDLIWYYIGAHLKSRLARGLLGTKTEAAIEKLSGPFVRNGSLVLFLSKFVYGTRIAAQVLSGVQGMPLRRYLTVNTLGVFSLTLALFLLAYLTESTVGDLENIVHNAQLSFLGFVVLIICGHLAFGSYIKKKWFR
jgi:Uncharacterized membrane-associated protein